MYKYLSICLLFIIPLLVMERTYAAIPYEFMAGQPAIADEVNTNFSSLDSRISTLEETNAMNQPIDVDCIVPINPFTYDPVIMTIGGSTFYEGMEYKLIAMPVMDPMTGETWTIKYLTEVDENGAIKMSIYAWTPDTIDEGHSGCFSVFINDYKVGVRMNTYSAVSFNKENMMSWTTKAKSTAVFLLGKVSFEISLGESSSMTSYIQDESPVYNVASRFTPDDMRIDKWEAIKMTSFLLNHISITKVQ